MKKISNAKFAGGVAVGLLAGLCTSRLLLRRSTISGDGNPLSGERLREIAEQTAARAKVQSCSDCVGLGGIYDLAVLFLMPPRC